MSEQKNTGGPAFPCDVNTARAWAVFENAKKPLSDNEYVDLLEQLQQGMTLRDYFAANAMQGFVRNWQDVYFDGDGEWEKKLSARAYKLADAMLEARKQ